MFDVLKKKIGNFSEKLKHAIQKESAKPQANPIPLTDSKNQQPHLKPPRDSDKRELKTHLGLAAKTKAVLTGEIELNEKDLEHLLDEFELSLLEADVEAQTAVQIVQKIKTQLTNQKILRDQNIDEFVSNQIKNALRKIITNTQPPDFLELITAKKPFIVLLLGPNGAGKTTTLAKLVYLLQQHHKTVVVAAADTFRAASIEQLEAHAQKLSVKVIKHRYGADPAAVGFDAIASAKAHGTDVVLIDSAGRQNTNQNLMRELEKIVRVCQPDLKLFVLEAYAGQSALEQVKEFDRHLHIDALVLTKIDADPKGGVALSISQALHKPVLFTGTGQGYSDLEPFDAEQILGKIV